MSDSRTVLVLGGGIGGVATARALRRLLPRAHRVVLVEREREHVFAPSLLWLMVGHRAARSIRRPLSRLARKGIDVLIGDIERINPAARRVSVAGHGELAGDYLVVSLGAELDSAAIPGLTEAGHNFYTLQGAEAFRDALRNLRTGRIMVLTAAPATNVLRLRTRPQCSLMPIAASRVVAEPFRLTCTPRSLRQWVWPAPLCRAR